MLKVINNNFNNIVRVYLAVSIFAYLIYLIAPLVSLIMNTQLYSFQRYLAVAGIGIIVYDLLFFRSGFKTKYAIFLYGLLVSAGISSVMAIEYGIKENLFDIIWLLIYIYIYYSYAERVGLEQVRKDIDFMYKHFLIIWFIAVAFSISTYLFNTSFRISANPYNSYLTRQGFMENRLFGIFMPLIISAMLSGILIIYGSMRYPKKKLIIFVNLVFFIHIILTGSRAALLSLMTVFALLIFYKVFTKYFLGKKTIYKIFMSSIISLALLGGLFLGTQILKTTLSYLPTFTVFKDNSMSFKSLLSKQPNLIVDGLENEGSESLKSHVNAEELLDRKDIDKSNISNGRLSIWGDYINMYKDISIFGLSPSNYSKYIHEHYQDLFIVQFIKSNHQDTYNVGGVYHPHNTYLMAYVTSGLVGLVCFTLVLLLMVRDTLARLFKKENAYLLLVTSILVFCLLNGLFDSIILFSNEIVTAISWIFLGLLAHILKEAK
ncbi:MULTISPECIES: O-antigen ligase family protein [unclassified Gemella]|uniref:O-antigen ligase family protein n=1 Tax=unclassified Gemella TaxID=2624949 RepID=UPI0015D06E86|nr:O-antigen ligase family protein [Gemella sp. GL1.1]NYS27210.1 O-antigen ligase family protein [Gemella sp. GL1]